MPEPQNIVDSPGDDADVEGVQPHHPEQMLCSASTSPAADGATTTTSTAVGNRFQVLGYEQVNRLHRVMETAVPIHGRGNFPTLDVKLRSLVQVVRAKLKSDGIVVRDVRLNGGAASYILGNETCEVYNDLDLIFGVDLSCQNDLKRAKDAVLSSLLDFLPTGVNKERISGASLNEAYVRKMVKIYDDVNRWSLISLSNVRGRNVELKFADRMRRQFEFSVDSFQIILDSLLTFYEVSRPAMTEHFYPTVVAESVYGSFDVALDHLNRKLIATRNPEEIRGGGLLKYCNLLVRGYRPTPDTDVSRLERYMCSRFFIDFPDVESQRIKLEHYLADHFNDDRPRHAYLATLWATINASTVCLMGHERRQTLGLIEALARVMIERRSMFGGKSAILGQCYPTSAALLPVPPTLPTVFDQTGSDLVIDQVYYGPFSCCPPVIYDHQFYAVYTYEYGSPTSAGSVTSTSSCASDVMSSTTSSCCPYCDACPDCAIVAGV